MERILLADNEADSLKTWAAVLRQAGYDVTEAPDVPTAQKLLVKGGFDLAVLDLHLERDKDDTDDSGLSLARIFRETVPIVLLTGHPTPGSVRDALQRDGRSSPAVAVVLKHKDGPEGLLKAVRQAIVPKIFVAHGHDPNATSAMVRFLERVGADAVVLKEQPVASQTIIDAFEEHANVQFAIILMTPDDEGRLKGEPDLKSRARQNVIFELGFLLAKLGRNRVVAFLKQGDPVEQPSNYQGVLYQEIDPWGEWQDKLISIMKAAGIELR